MRYRRRHKRLQPGARSPASGQLEFERTAIGEHLLLGGDNFDSALAHHVEKKLENIKLTLRQRYALRRACCASKEQLLRDSQLEHVPVTILGGGRAVVGQSLSVDLTRDEVVRSLTDGFLPSLRRMTFPRAAVQQDCVSSACPMPAIPQSPGTSPHF